MMVGTSLFCDSPSELASSVESTIWLKCKSNTEPVKLRDHKERIKDSPSCLAMAIQTANLTTKNAR